MLSKNNKKNVKVKSISDISNATMITYLHQYGLIVGKKKLINITMELLSNFLIKQEFGCFIKN